MMKEGEKVFVGQRYVEDKDRIEILIKFDIELPSKVNNFNVDIGSIHIRQYDGRIHVNYIKTVSKKLFDDIKMGFSAFRKGDPVPEDYSKRNPSQFIVGYIQEILPLINKEIVKRKYNEGHIILRTVSMFDLKNIFVLTKKGDPQAILWPLPLPEFPPIEDKDKDIYPDVFVKDLIDAMTEYFYYNLDECIRKVITSLENYFIYYNLRADKSNSNFLNRIFKKNFKIKKLVNKYIVEDHYQYQERDLKILRENILFIYGLRCSIIHNKLRLGIDNLMLCKKAIGTLCYIYQSKFVYKDRKFNYLFSFDMQFKMIADIVLGVNLDHIEKLEEGSSNNPGPIIENKDQLDNVMFSSLKITRRQKRMARKG